MGPFTPRTELCGSVGKNAALQCVSEHEGYDTLGLTCIYKEELDEDDFFDVSAYREELQDHLAEQSKAMG